MLLCYMPLKRGEEIQNMLCLVADKPDPLATPVPVIDLQVYTAAVFRIGAEEAFTTSKDESDGQLVITALEPASVYLTPNLSQFPGFKAKRVKIARMQGGGLKTYYAASRGNWEEWVANRERK